MPHKHTRARARAAPPPQFVTDTEDVAREVLASLPKDKVARAAAIARAKVGLCACVCVSWVLC
jgi:hypothetical protein